VQFVDDRGEVPVLPRVKEELSQLEVGFKPEPVVVGLLEGV